MLLSQPPPPHLNPNPNPLGSSIPAFIPHAISVSLPTWRDNVGYEEGEKRVVEAMQTGYPRFFIHRSIQKLQSICLTKFALPTESCTLLPSPSIASSARSFLLSRNPPITSRIVEFVICPSAASLIPLSSGAGNVSGTGNGIGMGNGEEVVVGGVDCIELQILLYHSDHAPIAKQFWQHTGDGISSRTAERALAFLGEGPAGSAPASAGGSGGSGHGHGQGDEGEEGLAVGAAGAGAAKMSYSRNRHYSRSKSALGVGVGAGAASSSLGNSGLARPSPITPTTPSIPSPLTPTPTTQTTQRPPAPGGKDLDDLSPDHSTFLEERYGRNLPLSSSRLAKLALRRRIAGVLLPCEKAASSGAGARELLNRGGGVGVDEGGVEGGKVVTEEDVYLYPTGMSAIFHAFQLAMRWKERETGVVGKSVMFGFPYTDTLKILQKWGPGCHFFGHGTTSDLTSLTSLLHSIRDTSSEPPITALFCEFPSNPLLRSADLKRLRELADEFGFVIVVDETIGNFVNVEVANWADVVVSSLTKVFSGDTNVMGGSLVLTPRSKHYESLKSTLALEYEDTYFPEDAIYMERNSRDFRTRIAQINDNAYDLTEYLASRAVGHPSAARDTVLKQVYYPRFITPENYATAQRFPPTGKGGFGGLFSVTFTTTAAAQAFFDALECCKGPSLGTNFTLACPYVILAHYLELDWVSEFGVDPALVRVSVGLESVEELKQAFGRALDEAQKTALLE